jgi:GxxExxY protein
MLELQKNNLRVEMEKEVVIYHEGKEVGRHRLDMFVEKKLVIELKTVEALSRAHYAQVRSYMKATNVGVAILVNFAREKADFRRLEAEKMKLR